jgi:hypothetical protein
VEGDVSPEIWCRLFEPKHTTSRQEGQARDP